MGEKKLNKQKILKIHKYKATNRQGEINSLATTRSDYSIKLLI